MNNSSIQPANITLSHFLSGNYGDLLRYSGLSHLQFSLLVIAIFLVMSFIYLLFKLGMLQGVKFRQQAIQQSTLIYKSYYGPNHQISTAFAQVIQDTNTVFKFSDSFAIYYQENQKDTLNKKGDQLNQVKALFGIVVNKIEQSKTDLFISKFKQYRTATIPKTRCVSTKYPYFNQMSFIAIVNRVYSQMKQYIDKKGIKVAPLTIQLYHLLGKQQFIRIMRPKENFDAFDLWQLPQQKQRSFRRPKRQ